MNFPFLNKEARSGKRRSKHTVKGVPDDHWWDEQRSLRLFDWSLSSDEQWYVGKAESATIRISSLAGFNTTDPNLEVLNPHNVWTAINRRVLKRSERAALWREARYALVVRHDLGLPSDCEQFDAFLSYPSDDANLAGRLARSLRSAGFRIWYDKWCLPINRSLPLEYYLRYGIKRSAVIIRLMFPYGVLVPLGLEDFNGWANRDRWSGCEPEIMNCADHYQMMAARSPRQVAQSFDQLRVDAGYRNSIVDELCNFREMVADFKKDLKSVDSDVIWRRVWRDEDPSIYVIAYSKALRRLAQGQT